MLGILGPLGAGGLAGYGIARMTAPSVDAGSSRPPNRTILEGRSGSPAEGRRVNAGALAWDPRYEQGEPGWVEVDGRRHRIGSAAACFATYRLTVRMGDVANRWTELLLREVPQSTRRAVYRTVFDTGQYDTDRLTERQRDIATMMVGAHIHFATMLRILSRVYRAAGIPVSARPAPPRLRCVLLAHALGAGAAGGDIDFGVVKNAWLKSDSTMSLISEAKSSRLPNPQTPQLA